MFIRIVVVIENHSFVHSLMLLANISRRVHDFCFLAHLQIRHKPRVIWTEKLTYKHDSSKVNIHAKNLRKREYSMNVLKIYEIAKWFTKTNSHDEKCMSSFNEWLQQLKKDRNQTGAALLASHLQYFDRSSGIICKGNTCNILNTKTMYALPFDFAAMCFCTYVIMFWGEK